jgi:general nucleoside transport system permease protein
MTLVGSMLSTTIVSATPIIYASTGLNFAERSGVLNIGIEGIMLVSAASSFIVAALTHSLLIAILTGVAVGLVLGLIVSILSVTLLVDQIVLGIGIWLLGLGLSEYMVETVLLRKVGSIYIQTLPHLNTSIIKGVPVLPEVLSQNALVFGAFASVVLGWFVLQRTMFGLRVSAVGQNPMEADVIGIRVKAIRYLCVIISGIFGGIAGAFITLGVSGTWEAGITAGDGFIALAIIRLGNRKPFWSMIGALIFGGFISLQFTVQVLGTGIPYPLVLTLPYVVGLVLITVSSRIKRTDPKALGLPYKRGTRG